MDRVTQFFSLKENNSFRIDPISRDPKTASPRALSKTQYSMFDIRIEIHYIINWCRLLKDPACEIIYVNISINIWITKSRKLSYHSSFVHGPAYYIHSRVKK